MKRLLILFCCILVSLSAVACANDTEAHTRSGFLMDTSYTLTAYGKNAETALDACIEKLAALDVELNWQNENSSLWTLNHADGAWTQLDNDAFFALQRAKEFAALTKGAFDPTIGAVLLCWDLFSGEVVPTAAEAAEAAKFVDYNGIEFDESTQNARLGAGQSVALGAIGKGYAADALRELYEANGVSGVIDLGGNILTVGDKPNGEAWRVAVRDPNDDAAYLKILAINGSCAVVTSGSYERFFEKDGVTYHHIFDPSNGLCADSGLVSVTIVTADAAEADALSTALFVLGLEDGRALAKASGVRAIFLTSDGTLIDTEDDA